MIMPFSHEMDRIYSDAIKPAISALDREPLRADEIQKPGVIVQQVWDGIRGASACVAELTDNNPNVLFEVGIAHALGKPVVPIVQNVGALPFDFQQLRHVTYSLDDIDGLREQLVAMLRATFLEPERAVLFKPRVSIGDLAGRWIGEFFETAFQDDAVGYDGEFSRWMKLHEGVTPNFTLDVRLAVEGPGLRGWADLVGYAKGAVPPESQVRVRVKGIDTRYVRVYYDNPKIEHFGSVLLEISPDRERLRGCYVSHGWNHRGLATGTVLCRRPSRDPRPNG